MLVFNVRFILPIIISDLISPSFFLASSTDGQLRHTKTGEPFVFNEREDLHRWNQKRYEALGEVIQKLRTAMFCRFCLILLGLLGSSVFNCF